MFKYIFTEVPLFIFKFGSTLSLIIQIIKEKNKNGWVTLSKQKACYIDPNLNLQKILQMGPRNKKYGTHIQKTLNF